MKRILEIIRDGHKTPIILKHPLSDGAQGNLEALEVMKQIVLEDRDERDLRNYILREIVKDFESQDRDGLIKSVFEFAQKGIAYVADPVGVERVMDIWSTMYSNLKQPEGDCGIKSCFLSSALAILGVKTCFIVLRDNPNFNSFNHVYVGLTDDNQNYIALDPTIEEPMGTEAPGINRAIFPIFD